MRLFIAVELNTEMKAALTGVQAALRRRGMRGGFTPAENLHLTLAFIGDYPDPDTVLEVMDTVSFSPFPLRLEGMGRFGDLWWAGLSACGGLDGCVRRLRRALAEADIPFDRKRFTPHITLVRRAVWDGRGGLPAAPVPDAGMEVSRITLMRSDRGKSGMIYTPLGTAPAQEP